MGNLWKDRWAQTIDPDNFRAPDQYLSQPEDYPWEAMVAHVRSRWEDGGNGVLHTLTEDGAFGCRVQHVYLQPPFFESRRLAVSRDLLDSINEISFLVSNFRQVDSDPKLHEMRVLDIGSGYGRFAHRFLSVFPSAMVYCADPIEVSRQVCAKYLKHRGIPGEGLVGQPLAIVVDPRKLAEVGPVDLAVNIHCWPECSREEIRWWLDWLKERRVPRLFVVPHEPTFRCNEDGESFLPDIEAAGYRMRTQWIGPECWPRTMALFHLEGT